MQSRDPETTPGESPTQTPCVCHPSGPCRTPASQMVTAGPVHPSQALVVAVHRARPADEAGTAWGSGRRPPRVPFTSASFWGPQSGL